ncbi:polysaccharide deacetylase family protein [Candidatus Woesearchaeota archaeon]|nr:polysaccharide deacetylase family protein [Candidatus Woesearchaeota archaeon]
MKTKQHRKKKAHHKKRHKGHHRLKIACFISALGFIILTSIITYLVWPFDYTLTITNSREASIIADITVLDDEGGVMFEGNRHVLETRLWKGEYTVIINSTGYDVERFKLVNRIGFKLHRDINETSVMEPRNISLTQFSFFDPTTSLELGPTIKITGKNILGDHVDKEHPSNSTVMYGDYVVHAYNDFFEANLQMIGDTLLQNGTAARKIVLQPNEKFMILSPDEADNTMNFLADFIDLSQRKLLDEEDAGLPKQFYLYKKDKVISLGKMLFLFCETQAYNEIGITPDAYFIPKEHNYWTIDSVPSIKGCYEKALIGAIPKNIGENHLQKELARKLLGKEEAVKHNLPDMNTEIRGPDVAFTFDIESGRYVFDDNGFAISPCESADYSRGLSDDELVCDMPEFVAWMSPLKGPASYTGYSYPHISGIVGYKQIIDYPARYGIPVTNYYVKKDLLAYEELSPELVEKTRDLVNKGLVEVGSHTRYHTHVGMVDEYTARREMRLSREFLAGHFNTSVVGFRAPYNAIMSSESRHAKALGIAGYEYFSQFGEFNGEVYGTGVEHKQWNSDWRYMSDIEPAVMREMVYSKPYIITLDHPWNMAYDEGDYLVENPSLLDWHRANVLTAISNTGIIVKAKDLDMNDDGGD